MLRMGLALVLMSAGGIYADRAYSAIAITWIACRLIAAMQREHGWRVLPVRREPAYQASRAAYPPVSGQG